MCPHARLEFLMQLLVLRRQQLFIFFRDGHGRRSFGRRRRRRLDIAGEGRSVLRRSGRASHGQTATKVSPVP